RDWRRLPTSGHVVRARAERRRGWDSIWSSAVHYVARRSPPVQVWAVRSASAVKVTACLDCYAVTTNRTRCVACAAKKKGVAAGLRPAPRQPAYAQSRWRTLSKRIRDEWVAEHGWVCPGWRRPAHPSRDLTVDHVVQLIDGGAAFDRSNLRVVCRA